MDNRLLDVYETTYDTYPHIQTPAHVDHDHVNEGLANAHPNYYYDSVICMS